ncbi:bis(5'-nucleosyl)-tetraphosphatase [asymmetrical] [Bacillus rossius redtenbacheri]|uniref:bis(5'-nucleosyl)-tetraphosphatase [asymmetrical] n=1 Tax=Bacillus rossius redtenbacheri TaxID=93214 RepID=UPI002FDED1FD
MASTVNKVKAAGFVIFRRINGEIQYLLLQTSYGIHHWTPPKGHLDPGESSLEAAVRETEEEAGLKKSDFKVTDFEKTLEYEAHGKPKSVTYWLAELTNPNAAVKLSHEHRAYDWFPLEKACEVSKFEDSQQLLRACHAFLTAQSGCASR